MKRTVLTFSLITALTALVGCSDLGKNKVVESPIESSQFNAGCDPEIDQFSNILTKDISFHIDCLDRNISLFMKVVESGRPGHLNRAAFEQYVLKYVPEYKPENVRAIKAIFDISYLFFGGDPEYISPESVRKIVDFAYLFNREAMKMHPLFSSTEQDTAINLHRVFQDRIIKGTQTISEALLDIYKPKSGEDMRKLNIIELLDAFSGAGEDTILDKVKTVLFVKRLLIGGERQVITHIELGKLLEKLVPLSPIVYDLLRLKYLDLNQKSQMQMLHSDLEKIEALLYFSPDSNEKLFSTMELADAINTFTTKKCKPKEVMEDGTICPPEGEIVSFMDLRKYPKELLELKMTLMTTERWKKDQDLTGREWVLPGELKLLIDHAKDIAMRGEVYHNIYEFFKTQLNSPASVNLNYNNYRLQFPKHEKYLKEFVRIVNGYRFFRGKNDAPFYGSAIRRNPEGMVEIGMMEHILSTAFRRYGEPTKELGGYGASQEQLLNIFKVYKGLLVSEDIIKDGLEGRTNQNLTLLSTLFQYQSNGDATIEVNEMTELAGIVMNSFQASDYFKEELTRLCRADDRGRISDMNCYRREFFGVACRKYREFYPKFFDSIGMKKCASGDDKDWSDTYSADTTKYLKTLEIVARTCTVFNDNTEVPMDSGDFMTVWVMIMNIEGTVARYDINGNNRMDASEVRTAYQVAFHPAVEALVKEQAAVIARLPFNLGKSISRKIYYYLIKYGAIPESVKQYMKLLFIKSSPANRQTIAAVLKVIGEQGEQSTFNCETLR